MSKYQADLVVIGAGPGGYVAAIKAAQLGLKVVCVDRRPVAGGTCLNVGCIPSKALLNASHKYWEMTHHFKELGIHCESPRIEVPQMLKMKDKVVEDLTKGIGFLFRKNGVTFLTGQGKILNPNTVQVSNSKGETEEIQTKNILIATGSESAQIPGISIDEKRVISSTGALDLDHIPEHLVVIGGGYIGLELGSVWARLGSRVTVVEYMDDIASTMDKEVRTALKKELERQGLQFKLGYKVSGLMERKSGLTLDLSPRDAEGREEALECDIALVSIGRKPCTENLGLESLGISLDKRGFIPVNNHFESSCSGIFAIGDCILGPMLAHKAEEEGIAVVEYLAGKKGHVNYNIIPAVIYTSPEVASVGLTEEQVKEKGIDYKVGKFPFSANSRAKTVLETSGFAKVLACARTDTLIGVHIIGEMAGTMIAEAAIAMEFGGSAEDIARTCHAHPTHSEALKEAALSAYDKAIHT